MNLPSILEVLDDSRMVNDARDSEMRERARFKASACYSEEPWEYEPIRYLKDKTYARQLSDEEFAFSIGSFLKEAIPTMIEKNNILEKSIDRNKNLHSRLASLFQPMQESDCLKEKFEKSEEIIGLGKQLDDTVKALPYAFGIPKSRRVPSFFDEGRVEKTDCLVERGREYKELCENNEKLFNKANSIHEQLNQIIQEALNIIEPPDFINLYQEWTKTFGEREISASKIVSAGCQNLTSEILRQERYLNLETKEEGEKVNAISAARALISLVERVFKESFLSYWNSLRAKELKYKIVCFITSNDGSSEEDVEKAFSESNFTLFTAEYFMRLVCEFVKINKEFEVSTNSFFSRDYVGWVNLNNSWDVLKKIRLNLRNPIMHPNKDWVDLSEYEKYSNFITGTDRFSNWFNTSRPGNLFFQMKGSPLLEGQLIAKGAL
jgi:hypothetical protein